MSDTHTDMLRDLNYTPALTGNAKQRALKGNLDAAQLAADIREVDPRQLWGRVYRWLDENPQRVAAAVISLAALAEPRPNAKGASPAWTEDFGGVAALHPDYGTTKLDPAQAANAAQYRDEILRLAEGGLTQREIALRLGIRESTVGHVRREAGVQRQRGPVVGRDKRIAELTAAGMSRQGIADVVCCSLRTVERAQARIAAASEAVA